MEEQLRGSDRPIEEINAVLVRTFDFAAALREAFVSGTRVQQRMILETVGSNYTLKRRRVLFSLAPPFALLSNAGSLSNWYRIPDDVRTWYLSRTEYFKIPDL